MTERELEALIDLYGGDLNRWPDDARRSVEQAVVNDPGLQSHIDRFRAVERMLQAAPHNDGYVGLVDRIMEEVGESQAAGDQVEPDPAPAQVLRAVAGSGIAPFAFLCASLLIGVVAGGVASAYFPRNNAVAESDEAVVLRAGATNITSILGL